MSGRAIISVEWAFAEGRRALCKMGTSHVLFFLFGLMLVGFDGARANRVAARAKRQGVTANNQPYRRRQTGWGPPGRYQRQVRWTIPAYRIGPAWRRSNAWNPRGPMSSPYQGTVWSSEWLPASKLDLSKVGKPLPLNYFPMVQANKLPASDEDLRGYVSRYFPGLNSWTAPKQEDLKNLPLVDSNKYPLIGEGAPASSSFGRVGAYYRHDPSSLPEVIVSCDRITCYKDCRMRSLGGGRCTKGGCLCYAAFFDYNGAPTSQFYPEDNIWFELPEAERDRIRKAMQSSRPGTDSQARPDYNPTSDDHDVQHDPVTRAPYIQASVPATEPWWKKDTETNINRDDSDNASGFSDDDVDDGLDDDGDDDW